MNTRSPLYTFLCVYRHGSQVQAARQLNLTQPAVSQQLKLLEERFGQPLFKRSGRTLSPTHAAHQLALQISKPIDSLEAIWSSLKLNAEPKKMVQLGGINSFYSSVIAPHLSMLTEQNIQCRFTFGHEGLVRSLLEKELDIALFCGPESSKGIEIEKFCTIEYILVGHPKWLKEIPKKAKGDNVLKSLMHLPWIAFDESLLFIKEYLLTVFEESFEGEISLMMPDLWSILNAVSGGCGITVLPSYLCQQPLKNQQVSILYHPKISPTLDLYLGWRDGALSNPYFKMTRNFLHDVIKKYHVI